MRKLIVLTDFVYGVKNLAIKLEDDDIVVSAEYNGHGDTCELIAIISREVK